MREPDQPPHLVLLARLEDERAKAERNARLCRHKETGLINDGMAGAYLTAEAHIIAAFEGAEAAVEYLRVAASRSRETGLDTPAAEQPEEPS